MGCGAVALAPDILLARLSTRTAQGEVTAAKAVAGRSFLHNSGVFCIIRPGEPRPPWARLEGYRASAPSGTRESFDGTLALSFSRSHSLTHWDGSLCTHLSVLRVSGACALDAGRGVRPRPEPPRLGVGSARQRVRLSLHTGSPGPRRAHRVRGIAPSPV